MPAKQSNCEFYPDVPLPVNTYFFPAITSRAPTPMHPSPGKHSRNVNGIPAMIIKIPIPLSISITP